MSIGKVCSDKVVTISKNASIQECAKLMEEKNVGSGLVCEDKPEDKKPIGLITDRDIAVKLVSKRTDLSKSNVSEVMSTDLLILQSNQEINKAIETMRAKRVRRAPIVDENNKVCGIVAIDDLLVMIATELNSLAELVKNQACENK